MTPAPAAPRSSADSRPDHAQLVVGLDIGGSKTHGALWRGDQLVAEAKAGSANVQNVTPEDAARLVGWLVSEEAGWVTGQVIASDGGWSVR